MAFIKGLVVNLDTSAMENVLGTHDWSFFLLVCEWNIFTCGEADRSSRDELFFFFFYESSKEGPKQA